MYRSWITVIPGSYSNKPVTFRFQATSIVLFLWISLKVITPSFCPQKLIPVGNKAIRF
jgi:hypothetical protein